MKKVISSLIFTIVSVLSFGQIIVTQTQSPQQLVDNVLTGSGVVITNVQYNYSNPDAQNVQTTIGYFNNNGTGFPIAEGVILGTGDVSLAIGPNTSGGSTNNNGTANPDPSDPDLAAISTATINNECILEFDFVPAGDTIVFNYIFASEEFPEYSPSTYNDAFGFFISGPGFAGPFSGGAENIAIIPGTTTPVTINNINPTTNASLYVSNTNGLDLQYDGHTVTLQASASVVCGQTYHIKLAIGDAGDQSFDSAVFLEANSFASNGVNVSIVSATGSNAITEACDSAIVTFTRPEDSDTVALTFPYVIGGTAINGIDYAQLPGSITFPIGVDTVQFYVTPFNDGITEGTETVEFSVDIINSCGDTITTTATIEIQDPQTYNVVATDTIITCPTDSIMIQVMTDGGIPAFDYTWQLGGLGDTLWVPALVDGTIGYTVDVIDACGVTSQGTVNVTVASAPLPTLNFISQSVVICPSQTANFEITGINNQYTPGAETYNWYNPVGLSSTNTISVSPNVTTWYYVDVFDGCYTVTDSVKAEMGDIDLTAINVVDALNCPGQSSPILGEIEIFPNSAGWQYTINGGGVTVGPQAANQFLNLTGGITYFINVVDNFGCEIDTNIYVGSAITATTATWEVSVLDSITCNGDNDGSAEITNIQGGLNNGPYNVSWTNQTGLFNSSSQTQGQGSAMNNLTGGTWVVTVIEDVSGCAWSHPFTMYEPAPLTVAPIYSNPSCFGLSDGDITAVVAGGNPITAGVGNVTITNSAGTLLNNGPQDLTINNLVTDTYTITAIDDKGCNSTFTFLLDEPAEISIDFTVANPNCFGIETGTVLIDTVYNYQDTPYDSLFYIWNPDPNSNGGFGEDLGNYLRFVGEGNYQLKITDGNNCFKFFDFDIEYPDSIYWNELGFEPTVCRNQIPFDNGSGQVYAGAAGGSDGNGNGINFDYFWLETSTGNNTVNSTWGSRDPGWYIVTASSDLGCILRDSIYVDSLSPEAIFTMDLSSTYGALNNPNEGTAVVDIVLTNQSLNYNFANEPLPYGNSNPSVDTNFIWTFGLVGQTPTEVNTSYDDITQLINRQYTTEGIYEVCLIVVENLNGCKDTMCQELIVHDIPALTTPNIFTPGGNGQNNLYFFIGQGVVTFSCQVFNAWGNQVFQFNDFSDTWDGTNMNNGSPCVDGTYFYTYTLTYSNGLTDQGQGNIQLVND